MEKEVKSNFVQSLNKYLPFLIIAIGVFLRFFRLGYNSIWSDEGCVIHVVSMGIGDLFKFLIYFDAHPPLYYLIMFIYGKFLLLFETSLASNEALARLPSAFFGSASIVVFYFFGKKLFGRNISLIATLLLSFSNSNIIMTQEVRMYPLLQLMILLSFYYFALIIKRESPKNSWYLAQGLFSLLAMYTQYLAGIVVLVQSFLAWIYRDKVDLKRWFLVQAAVFLLYFPGAIIFIYQAIHKFGPHIPFFYSRMILDTFVIFSAGFCVPLVPVSINYLLIASFIFFATVFGIDYLRRDKKLMALVLLYLFSAIFVIFIVSKTVRVLYSPRYFLFLSPAFFILITLAMERLKEIKLKFINIAVYILLAALVIVNIYSNYNWYFDPAYQRQNWRDAATLIDLNIGPEDGVILQNSYQFYAFDIYFHKQNFVYFLKPEHIKGGTIQEVAKRHKIIWYVESCAFQVDPDFEVLKWLQKHMIWIGYKHFENKLEDRSTIYLYIFKRKG